MHGYGAKRTGPGDATAKQYANHVRSKREGLVTGEATVLYRGRTNTVWEIKIRDEAGKLICVSRCTVAIVDRPVSAEKPLILS